MINTNAPNINATEDFIFFISKECIGHNDCARGKCVNGKCKSIECVIDKDCLRKKKNSKSRYLCNNGKCEEDIDNIPPGQLLGMSAQSGNNF